MCYLSPEGSFPKPHCGAGGGVGIMTEAFGHPTLFAARRGLSSQDL